MSILCNLCPKWEGSEAWNISGDADLITDDTNRGRYFHALADEDDLSAHTCAKKGTMGDLTPVLEFATPASFGERAFSSTVKPDTGNRSENEENNDDNDDNDDHDDNNDNYDINDNSVGAKRPDVLNDGAISVKMSALSSTSNSLLASSVPPSSPPPSPFWESRVFQVEDKVSFEMWDLKARAWALGFR